MSKRLKKIEDQQSVDTEIMDEKEASAALINVEGSRLPDRRVHSLDNKEKEICSQVSVRGVDHLRYELRWSANDIKLFMGRVAVQSELDYLRRAYSQREGIQERTIFFSQIKINSMVPASLNVIARVLRGDKLNTNTGEIERAPSRAQFDAAMTVLDRANIQAKFKGVDTIPQIDARSVNVSLGDKGDSVDMSTRKGREHVRSFVNNLLGDLQDRPKKKKPKRRSKLRAPSKKV